jgi:hypothetical protein
MAAGATTIANAQERNDSWLKVQNHLERNKQFIAHEIISKYELPGDDSPLQGTYRTIVKEELELSDPTRKLSPITNESELGMKMAAMNFGIAEKLANRPAELFTQYSTIEFLGHEKGNGTELNIFQLHSKFSKTGEFPLTAKIWVNQENHPVKVEGIIEKMPLPGVKNVYFTIKYEDDRNGNSFPKDIVVTYPIKIFIYSGTVFFQHILSSWKKKATYVTDKAKDVSPKDHTEN